MTVAKFQGGGAFNVIPDSVAIGGTFRAFSKESLLQLRQRIEEVHQLNNASIRLTTFQTSEVSCLISLSRNYSREHVTVLLTIMATY